MNTATTSRERPVTLTADEVRAALANEAGQFRRLMVPQPCERHGRVTYWTSETADRINPDLGQPAGEFACIARNFCPFSQPGGRLWIREPYYDHHCTIACRPRWQYQGDGRSTDGVRWENPERMPRQASRLAIDVTAIRVERSPAGTWVWVVEFKRDPSPA